ncbi:MAG: CPBP family intramembrane glutamic endopeptidase [Acidobacteriaceae bacterium]
MKLFHGPGRARAFFRFLAAVAWLLLAYLLAVKAAHGFSRGAAFPLVRNLFDIFLLILGFGYMELSWENTREPLRAMGLGKRAGRAGEFGLGAALGWGMAVAVMLLVALGGHLYVQLWSSPQAWGLVVLQLLTLAAGALAGEIAFRGYAFQRLIDSIGPWLATILAGIIFGILRMETPGATPAAMWVSGVAAVLLSVAYLRTRALWLSWGIHFAWLASIGVLFGQPLAGSRETASVVQTYADGPWWLTGNEYGPERSLIALAALWIGLYILVRITRDLAWKHCQPELKPAGVPMDLGHPMRPAPPPPAASAPTPPAVVGGLVQIAPAAPVNPPAEEPLED